MAESEDAALLRSLRRFLALAAPGRRRDCWTEALLTHPKYPNASAIIDALRPVGVDCAAVRADVSQLAQLTIPSLLHLHSGQFAVLESVDHERVQWSHPRTGRQRIPHDELKNTWSGIALIVDAVTAPAGDCAARRRPGTATVIVAAVVTLLVLAGIAAIRTGATTATAAILLALHAAGAAVALTLGAGNEHSRLAAALCPAGAAFDCRRVLDSRASSLFGIDLVDWAAAYFIGGLLSFTLAMLTATQLMPLWGWLTLLTVPVVAASVIVQALMIRAWCAGCLTLDAILLVQALLSWRHRGAVDAEALHIAAAGFCIAAIILAARSAIPAAQLQAGRRYVRFRRDPGVLAGLLANTPALQLPATPPRLVAGPADAPVALTLITSPYCPACAEAHAELHTLTAKAGIRAAMFFLCDVQRDDAGTRAVVAAQALALSNRLNEALALIDAWYTALRERRTFDERQWNALYASLPQEIITAAKMELAGQPQWIYAAGINATPAVLLYGRRLPAHYRPEELQDMDLGAVARLMSAPPVASATHTPTRD